MRSKLWTVIAGVATFSMACGQAANGPTADGSVSPENNTNAAATPSATVDEKRLAKDLYAKNCMICHKDTGKGGEMTIEGKTIEPDDLTAAPMKAKSDDQLHKYISDGVPDKGMPAFKTKLSPEQIKTVVGHIRVLPGSIDGG